MVPEGKRTAGGVGKRRPASRKEEAMWLLERLAPESRANNLSLAFQVSGKLDLSAVHQGVQALCRRYDVLRTVYFADGAELVKSLVPAEDFEIVLEEFDELVPVEDPGLGLRPFVNGRFALDGRPLLRAGLFHHPDGDVVCLAFHHLVYDIISGTVLLEELVALYEAYVDGLAPAPELLTVLPAFDEPEPTAENLDFWRELLGDFDPAPLDLWCGSEDPAEPTLVGDHQVHVLSAEATATVRRLQREVRAPEAVVLLAAYNLLLAAHGAGPDIVVGSPVTVRPKDAPRTVGHHTNVLPLRVLVDPAESFRLLVRRARDAYFSALSHADVPVDCISELVPRARASWRSRLFRHLFNYFPQLGMGEFAVSGHVARPVVVENGYSKFDLEFFIASSPEAISVTARYGTEKLDHADARALLLRYEALLVGLGEEVDRPTGELLAWSAEDRRVIDGASDTHRTFEPANVLEAVRARAGATPEAVAVEHGERQVSYRQLWATAVGTRAMLAERGVGAGDIVAIAAARSPELVAAVLGIWLTGAAYLPVDPEHPAQRLAYLFTDARARIVLSDRELSVTGDDTARLPLPAVLEDAEVRESEAQDGEAWEAAASVRIDPEACAYLIYTSGSTGRPKGALIPHRAISNIAADYTVRLRLTPDDATLWMTTFAFDMANLEHYVPLYSGGRIVIAPDEARTDGAVLRRLIERHRPGVIQATPTTWRLVLDEVAGHLSGLRVVTGAEVVPVALVRRLLETGCEVHHAYGPTETTTWCTWGIITSDPGERLDVGVPIWNTQVMVVAPDGRELPVGVRGELWIAGDGVALGYKDRPDLNADRFGDHPRHGRFYRSGDLGRWLPNGTLELFGRADRQVKLRGNRIELGEVEAVVTGHPRVRAAAAVVVGDRSSDGRLVVFVEVADGGDTCDDLWEFARAELPRSALPQEFLVIDAFPVNANEKVDYLALERMASDRTAPARGGEVEIEPEPDDTLVRSLVALWRELLGRDDVTAATNFFTHGGHSLLGARLVQEAEQLTGTSVKLADLFTAPTPQSLADHLRAAITAAE